MRFMIFKIIWAPDITKSADFIKTISVRELFSPKPAMERAVCEKRYWTKNPESSGEVPLICKREEILPILGIRLQPKANLYLNPLKTRTAKNLNTPPKKRIPKPVRANHN